MTVRYSIHTKSNGTINVKFNTAAPNNWTRGETATFEFEFQPYGQDVTFSSNYTTSGNEVYNVVTVESGVTLTIPSGAVLQCEQLINDGTIDNAGTLIVNDGDISNPFTDYVDFAGEYSTSTMLNGIEKYRNNIPTNIEMDSLLWGIEPSQELKDKGIVGVWGLVDSISNQRNQTLNINRYQVDLFVLAPYEDYADVTGVENALEL